MKTSFIETNNWNRLNEASAALRELPEEEPRLGVVCGRTGLGKSMAIRRLAILNGYAFLSAIDAWSPASMLRALARELETYEHRERARNFEQCVAKLRDSGRHVIFDEADYVASDKHLLATVRDLHDHTGCSIILVGEEGLPAKLERVPHFWGRVARRVQFSPLTGEEISLIAHKLAGIVLSDQLCEEIKTKSRGEFRRAKMLLRQLELAMRAQKGREADGGMIEAAWKAIERKAA